MRFDVDGSDEEVFAPVRDLLVRLVPRSLAVPSCVDQVLQRMNHSRTPFDSVSFIRTAVTAPDATVIPATSHIAPGSPTTSAATPFFAGRIRQGCTHACAIQPEERNSP